MRLAAAVAVAVAVALAVAVAVAVVVAVAVAAAVAVAVAVAVGVVSRLGTPSSLTLGALARLASKPDRPGWFVRQIERSRSFKHPARLDRAPDRVFVSQIACWTRSLQIGVFTRSARLGSIPDRQIEDLARLDSF